MLKYSKDIIRIIETVAVNEPITSYRIGKLLEITGNKIPTLYTNISNLTKNGVFYYKEIQNPKNKEQKTKVYYLNKKFRVKHKDMIFLVYVIGDVHAPAVINCKYKNECNDKIHFSPKCRLYKELPEKVINFLFDGHAPSN